MVAQYLRQRGLANDLFLVAAELVSFVNQDDTAIVGVERLAFGRHPPERTGEHANAVASRVLFRDHEPHRGLEREVRAIDDANPVCALRVDPLHDLRELLERGCLATPDLTL